VGPTALLIADLYDLLGAGGFGQEFFAFFNRVGDGLFAVDIFAGGYGVEDHADVPVVGGADDDRVDIFAVEEYPVVLIGLALRS